ncbi:hypothetical protein K502DRAFT_352861 [Neoconidiobolus thromboides FSU 785]|nr:hypothetical protein K502DRAFT_352861 [Neoconidiobolus thromboides FSU 785]
MGLEEVVCSNEYSGLPTYEQVIEESLEFTESNESHSLPTNLEIEISQSGVLSHDERLNQDPILLKNFIYTHNVKPEMKIHIEGKRKESYEATEVYYENNEKKERQVKMTRHIIDFSKVFDLTNYISQRGEIYSTNRAEDSEFKLEQEINNYIQSEATLKEFKLIKEVIWDYDLLAKKIKKVLRMEGYRHKICIYYTFNRKEIIIRKKNWINTFINNPLFVALNVVSLAFIVTWPLSTIFKETYCDSLKSKFTMNISTNTWFQKNLFDIKEIIYEI